MRIRPKRRWLTWATPGLLLFAALAPAAPDTATRPRYASDGKLEAPVGFHTWVFVGADLSPQYKPDVPESTPREQNRHEDARPGDFHNIYINREAYDEYVKSRTFPDPTILVMEVFQASERDDKGVLASGKFEAQRVSMEAAVKDTKRPGGGKDWAYYAFDLAGNPAKVAPVAAMPDNQCYACHLRHASVDNVWVQFYPVLRDLPKPGAAH